MLELIKQKQEQLRINRDRLNYILGTRNTLLEEKNQKDKNLVDLKHMVEVYGKVTLLLQGASESARQSIVSRIEKIVTEALREIMTKEKLSFKVIFESKRGASEVKFEIFDEVIKQELSLLHSFGGGIKDVVSTLLRVTVLELDRARSQGPIILDETNPHISAEYQENFGRFLRVLSEKLERQIILVTQRVELVSQAHKIFQIAKKDGKSFIEEN